MTDKKLVDVVIGTRPEAIKMAPIILAFQAKPSEFGLRIITTGQHREMLDQVLGIFKIRPDQNLDIMTPNQSLADITTRCLSKLDRVLCEKKSDILLVHGDTSTTLAASLAAFYHQIPIAHVEAGLRSFDRYNPFPEEINRVLCDALSSWHFVPTRTSRDNLLKEGISDACIFITGNSGIDALKLAVRGMEDHTFPRASDSVLNASKRPYVLVTAHRRENFGIPIVNLCGALASIAQQVDEIDFVYPVHPNPNIVGPVYDQLGSFNNIHLIKPVNYGDFVYLMSNCKFIVTDSGGIQEEGPSLGKPVLVFRQVTERPEAVEAGTAKLIGVGRSEVEAAILSLIRDEQEYEKMAGAVNPYGDGFAASRIVETMRFYFGFSAEPPRYFET